MTVADIYRKIDELAPFSTQESWDNSGLIVGSPDTEVTKVITTLDITSEVAEEAHRSGAQLIVSHHPVIFHPLKRLTGDSPAALLAKYDISAICTHTPFDMAPCGMNKGLFDILHEPLGLSEAYEPLEDFGQGRMIGRIYYLSVPISPEQCAKRLRSVLGCSVIRYTGGNRKIRKAAVCSGAGNSFVLTAAERADALITGDLKHDSFIDAQNLGLSLFDCGHYHTERIFAPMMKALLEEHFPGLCVSAAASMHDPVIYC